MGDVKIRLKDEGKTTIQKWVADNNLPFSHQYANGCDRLAKVYDTSFKPAHEWYRQSGVAAGYRVKKNSGWEYALEVIAFHAKSQRGDAPEGETDAEKPPKETQREKIEKLEKTLADREQEVSTLFDALNRLATLYRQTAEGANYVDPTLKVIQVARKQPAEAAEKDSATKAANDLSAPVVCGDEAAHQTEVEQAFKEAA